MQDDTTGPFEKDPPEELDRALTSFLHEKDHPEKIGPYRILRVLGTGGMGVVYLGQKREPVVQRVALKVIKRGMDSVMLRRFEVERRALAMMDHNNIARVYDAGTTEDGQPYLAMEYVHGAPITEYCDSRRSSLEERLRLISQACSGVQHAHQKGVIHRDLTHKNILVTDRDGKPIPKIIDFGIARATDPQLIKETLYTEPGIIIGTPEYMSPEQAGLGAMDIDWRTDIYTLGVLLYRLLVGTLPFSETSILELTRKIREDDAPRPSLSMATSAADPRGVATRLRMDVRTLTRKLRDDLDWIVLKALEKDRTRRYQTALELSQEIERHLNRQPLTVRPSTFLYTTRKFVRRHRLQVATAALIFVMLTVGMILSWVWYKDREALLADFNRVAMLVKLNDAIEVERSELQYEWPTAATLPANAASDVDWIRVYSDWCGEYADRLDGWVRDQDENLISQLPILRDAYSRHLAEDARDSTDTPASYEDEFLHMQYDELLEGLEAFEAEQFKYVTERLAWVRGLTAKTITEHRTAWDTARKEIADSDNYGGFVLPPQLGLIPIGWNSQGLYEFYHPRSGISDVPSEDPEGSISMTENLGMIFVLIPGFVLTPGIEPFWIGPDIAENEAIELPIPGKIFKQQIGRLDPFFLSKYEMTQGQYERLAGHNPSILKPSNTSYSEYLDPRTQQSFIPRFTIAHPVENVSWETCDTLLTSIGLDLPTGVQWEYAIRGGTRTPFEDLYWIGSDEEFTGLPKGENPGNVAGLELTIQLGAGNYLYLGPDNWKYDEDSSDDWLLHAPVGQFSANPFGLYDMIGNVYEWCKDQRYNYDVSPRAGDGLRVIEGETVDDQTQRELRGGSWSRARVSGQSGNRYNIIQEWVDWDLGMRPARRVIAR